MQPLQTGNMDQSVFIKYIHQHDKLDERSLIELKKLTDDYPWFAAGWMLYLKNLKELDHPDFDSVLKKVAILVPDRKQLYRFLNNEIHFSESDDYQISNISGGGNSSLIDRFLTEKPGAPRHLQQDGEPSGTKDNKDIIEKSVYEDDEMITETLAKLYFQQNKYEKALEAYKKLSLKFPEKSIYFASQIKEIEELKNNN